MRGAVWSDTVRGMIDARPFPGQPGVVLLPVKGVPGARRDEVVGRLGERLKVRVSAPPEGGRANRAICAAVARALGLPAGRVSIHSGGTNPEKVLRVEGITPEQIRERWP